MKNKVFSVIILALMVFSQADSIVGSIKIFSEPVYAEPFPAEPGKYFDLWLKIQNTGYALNESECEARPKYPFSMDTDVPVKKLGHMAQYAYGYLKYTFRVAGNAAQGDNDLPVRCRASPVQAWNEAVIKIPVKTAQPTLNIDVVELEPSEIRPGNQARMLVTVKNYAPNALKDVLVKLDLSNSPLAPFGGSIEKMVSSLEAGDSSRVEFSLIAFPDAVAGIYRIPVKITYADYSGTLYSKDEVASVIVSDAPRLTIGVESTNIIRSGVQGKISLKVVNEGLAEAKFAKLSVLPSSGVEVLSIQEQYLGTINSDDFETAEYTVFVKTTGSKSTVLPVRLDFSDSLNRNQSLSVDVPVRLYSEEEIRTLKLEETGGTNIAVVLVVLAVAGFVGWKAYQRFRKK